MNKVTSLCASLRRHPVYATLLATPFVLLALLHAVNPFLRQTSDATYCAPPPPSTVLEGSIWIFPSPIFHWLGYSIAFLVIYLVIFLVRRSIKAARMHTNDLPENAPSAFKVIAPFLWVILGVVGVGVIMALAAAAGNHDWFFLYALMSFVNYLIPFMLLMGVLLFIFGAYQYFIPGLDGNMNSRRNGRIRMFFALLLLFFVIVIWFMVALMNQLTGIEQGAGGGGSVYMPTVPMSETLSTPRNTIGFSVGGAKDADNFRENIEQCYLPIPTDITYEGLFYDYVFDTKNVSGCTGLFCPQYEGAVVADPFSGQDEYFLSVGLGSNIDADTFARVPLDVVVVLDISGSMGSSFNRYYYDQFRDPGSRPENADWNTSKMEIAKEALGAMVDRLHADDRFGLVVFDNVAETRLTPFTMGQNGYAKAKNAVYPLQPRGGTNMEAGLEMGTAVIKALEQEDGIDRERRIVFLTDAMPNTGAIEQNDLYRIGKRNAAEGIHTTFIGVGVDFNTQLVEALTKEIRGANYYAIHSSTDFEKRLDIEFEYMVAPLVYDLTLEIEGGDYEIRAVYGSPEAHLATGEILKVSTLFPSPSAEGSSRGGVILAHMKKVRDTGTTTKVVASYTDRAGVTHSESGVVDWSEVRGESASANVQKAVLLARYVNLVQNWLIDENDRLGRPEKTVYRPIYTYGFYDGGLVIPAERYPDRKVVFTPHELNYWERLSRNLVVSEDYKQLFKDFRIHMEEELQVVSESEKLKEEVQLLKNLENSPNSTYTPTNKSGVDTITRERE
jgi:Ca-activated chloride channel homolog